jgi:hypothetical protein
MNEVKIKVKKLEDDLLARVSHPGASLIEDVELMDALDRSKKVSAELNERVQKAVEAGAEINIHLEVYHQVAARAELLYFILVDLSKIDHMYQFSLSSFITVFVRAMDLAETANESFTQKRIDTTEKTKFEKQKTEFRLEIIKFEAKKNESFHQKRIDPAQNSEHTTEKTKLMKQTTEFSPETIKFEAKKNFMGKKEDK